MLPERLDGRSRRCSRIHVLAAPCAALVLLAVAAGSVGAQPEGRGIYRRGFGPAGSGLSVRVVVRPSTVHAGIVVETRAAYFSVAKVTTEIDLPAVSAPYDVAVTRTSNPQEVLLVGDDKLIALRRSPSHTFQVAWQTSISGSYLTGVTYASSAGRLYVLDAQGAVRFTSYQVGGVVPSAWATIADSTNLPTSILPELGKYALTSVEANGNVEVFVEDWFSGSQQDSVKITHSATSVTVATELGIENKRVRINHWTLGLGQTAVGVYGPGASTVSLVRVDPAGHHVVGSTVLGGSSGTSVFGTIAVPALEWGEIYAGLSSVTNEMYGPFLTPQLHWATQDELPNNVTFHEPVSTAGLFSHGGGWVDASLTVNISPAQTSLGSVSYPAELGISFDDPANRPIVFGSGSPVLIPAVTLPSTLVVEPTGGEPLAQVPHHIEVPSDPALVGTVYLFQWFVHLSPGIAVSDISGVIVRAGEWEVKNPLTYAGSSLQGRPQPLRATADPGCWKRIIAQLAKLPGAKRLSPSEQRAFVKKVLDQRSSVPKR